MRRRSRHLKTPDSLHIAHTCDTLEPLGIQSPGLRGVAGSVEIVCHPGHPWFGDWRNVEDAFDSVGRDWAPGESESTLDTPRSPETRDTTETTETPW